MAFSHRERFDPFLQEVAQIGRSVGHPARVQILAVLLEHGTTCFQELSQMIPLHRTTISQHVRTLLQHSLVEVSEQFPHTYYRINPERIRAVIRVIELSMENLKRLAEQLPIEDADLPEQTD